MLYTEMSTINYDLEGGRKYGICLFGLFNIILLLGLIGVGIYGFILFVKLANRGIKALDIYINEKTNNRY